MCKDYRQWCERTPSVLPTYSKSSVSTYSASTLAREYPKLFFARPLVEEILQTEYQELASHTYSHFYCGESGATTQQFSADMACQRDIFSEYAAKIESFVFPRNQIRANYVELLAENGILAYRGNQSHSLYHDGYFLPSSPLQRVFRKIDGYVSLTGEHVSYPDRNITLGQPMNIPASRFLFRATGIDFLDKVHLSRVKNGMLEAAKSGGTFHLWWHPHNFGVDTERNLDNLKVILDFYLFLAEKYGMQNMTMSEFAKSITDLAPI
jgi:hypothetical protein